MEAGVRENGEKYMEEKPASARKDCVGGIGTEEWVWASRIPLTFDIKRVSPDRERLRVSDI